MFRRGTELTGTEFTTTPISDAIDVTSTAC
jgi:hypothetical protein